MSKKYKVLCPRGIILDGGHVEQGKTFEPRDGILPWCDAMVLRGNLARIDEPAPKPKPAKE